MLSNTSAARGKKNRSWAAMGGVLNEAKRQDYFVYAGI
jgi:hypothetical protein